MNADGCRGLSDHEVPGIWECTEISCGKKGAISGQKRAQKWKSTSENIAELKNIHSLVEMYVWFNHGSVFASV